MVRRSLAVVVALGLVVAVGCGAQGGGPAAVASGMRTRLGPRAAAQQESRRLLATLTVPPGAKQVPRAPRHLLDGPAVHVLTDQIVDSTASFTLPLSPGDALGWLDAHRPANVTAGYPGMDGGGDYPFLVENGAGTQQYDAPQLVLSLAPLGADGSVLRADVEVTWYPDRSAAERVPVGATVAVAYRADGTGPFRGRRVLTGAPARGVTTAFDALRVRQGGRYNCGGRPGYTIEMSFPTVSGGLDAQADTGGCGDVTVTADGGPQPTLSLTPALRDFLLADLRLPARPPEPRPVGPVPARRT